MKEIKWIVEKQECPGCEKRIENLLLEIEGVKEVKANHQDQTVFIKMKETVNEEQLKKTLEDMGLTVKTL